MANCQAIAKKDQDIDVTHEHTSKIPNTILAKRISDSVERMIFSPVLLVWPVGGSNSIPSMYSFLV